MSVAKLGLELGYMGLTLPLRELLSRWKGMELRLLLSGLYLQKHVLELANAPQIRKVPIKDTREPA